MATLLKVSERACFDRLGLRRGMDTTYCENTRYRNVTETKPFDQLWAGGRFAMGRRTLYCGLKDVLLWVRGRFTMG